MSDSGISLRLAAGAIAIAAASALPAGCVFREQSEARRARDAYRACLGRHAGDTSQCDPEWQRYLAAVERYEETSRRAWGCDPVQEECPTRR
jgi:hypothetical protein